MVRPTALSKCGQALRALAVTPPPQAFGSPSGRPSKSATFAPPFASNSAANEPAGPAPIIRRLNPVPGFIIFSAALEYQSFPPKYERRFMAAQSSLVFSGIAPHPPIMVPEVGRESIAGVVDSIDAMSELTRRLIDSGAESVILISPHAPLEVDSFVAYEGPQVSGDFSRFNAPGTGFTTSIDEELLAAIKEAAASEHYNVTTLPEHDLDHGTAVPLYFLLRNGWRGKVVTLGYSFLSNHDHLRFGSCIRKAADQVGRRVAFIASGDLSHRLKPQAPAGYNPNAHVFDEQVVEALRSNDPERIVDIDFNLRRLAGECGYRSMLVAIGASSELPLSCEVLSYEAPFGVGYLVAQITNQTIRAVTEVSLPT